VQARGAPAAGAVGEPANASLVIAMNPIAKRLPVHPAGLRRLMPAMAIQNHGDRKNAQPLLGVPRPPRRRAKLLDAVRVTAIATIVPRESMTLPGTHIQPLRGIPSGVKTFGRWYDATRPATPPRRKPP
jgi:hypothetical protein